VVHLQARSLGQGLIWRAGLANDPVSASQVVILGATYGAWFSKC